MSRWRKRQIDLQIASRKLDATEKQVLDLAARRARLEAEVALYALRRKRGPHDRSD